MISRKRIEQDWTRAEDVNIWVWAFFKHYSQNLIRGEWH